MKLIWVSYILLVILIMLDIKKFKADLEETVKLFLDPKNLISYKYDIYNIK